jgi:hypothetical protein
MIRVMDKTCNKINTYQADIGQIKMTEVPEAHDRKQIKQVLSRLRKPGGIPWSDKQLEQLTSWFRTLVIRGLTKQEFFENGQEVQRTFKESFENPMTRCQYTRAILLYLTALTDAEFSQQFPDLTRTHIADTLNEITRQAGVQRRKQKGFRNPNDAQSNAP